MQLKDQGKQDLSNTDRIRKVHHIRWLSENTYVVRFNRNGMEFKCGQFVSAAVLGSRQRREYSIYSGEKDDYLEILIREIINGNLSVRLKFSETNDLIDVVGPFGFMSLNAEQIPSKKFILVASGTGIAPFHSIVRTYPQLDYNLIHGVRYGEEAYEREDYNPERYFLCTSKDNKGDMKGRVTDYIRDIEVNKDMVFYLSGNGNMIYEVYHILKNKGIPDDLVHAEVYF